MGTWCDANGREYPIKSISHVCGIPLRVSTDCPRGRLYLTKGVFQVNPNDTWSFNDFQSTLNQHREKGLMGQSRNPEYVNGVREDRLPYTVGYWQDQALKYAEENAKLRLEIHRLDSDKQTEACCTIEMRDSLQREIEKLSACLNGVREALGKEWDGFFIEDAVAQLKRDHIGSVKQADRLLALGQKIKTFVDEVVAGNHDD